MHYKSDARHGSGGVALVIVLAFVVLLAVLVVAYLGRTSSHRAMGQSSLNEAKADQLARSALNIIVGDLKQEIANGSVTTTVNSITIYAATSANIEPQRSGGDVLIPNLIRRSIRSDSIPLPGVGSRASPINSAADLSSNGRSVSAARWNRHYLIPKIDTSNEASDPINTFTTPDWVIATRNGPQVFNAWDNTLRDTSSANFSVGRYAFALYDEGGLIDVSAAGYPTDASLPGTVVATSAPVGGKGWLALADLTQVIPTAPISAQRAAANKVVGWRNYATGQPGGTFPNFTFTAPSGATWYTNFVVNNNSGFLRASGLTWRGPSGTDPDRTDQAFISRQELIEYRSSAQFSVNALQYLGTFSRELNNPTWGTAATQRATTVFTRRDGSAAQIGEPLFRRFPVSELGWLGPTGITGTGTVATVKRDFGLVWNTDHWDYYGASGSGLASVIPPITGNQEPDFFQILAFARGYYQSAATMQQILTTGACLIDQYDGPPADSGNLTTRIDYAGPPTPPSATNSIAWGLEAITPPAPTGAPTPRTTGILNRPFTNVGEFGYANKDITLPAPAPVPTTLDFYSAGSADAGILDLFAMSTARTRAGVANLNTRQDPVLRAILSFATATQPSTALSSARRNSTAAGLISSTNANAATSLQDIARLAAQSGITGGEEVQEVVARSLADTCQTRTWNLMIDVIAQSGRYPPPAADLRQFVVEGEKRYWLHVAIDRFTGEVIDQQLEPVYE